jgi:hypothetical protein
MAGGLALVFGKTPFTLDQVKTILEKRAVDLGPAGKDNPTIGWGICARIFFKHISFSDLKG